MPRMLDLNAIKIQLKQLNPRLVIKSGDKIDKQINIKDFNYSPLVVVLTPNDTNPDLISSEIKRLSRQKNQPKQKRLAGITLSPYLGIVISPELPGTRVNLEFAITNNLDHPIVVKGVDAILNNEPLHFKSFFKVNANNSREPDFSTRLPIVVNSRGSAIIPVVLENFSKGIIAEGRFEGEIYVLLGDKKIAKEKYVLTVNRPMIETLSGLREVAFKNNVAIVFDAMIES